ncbi:Acetyltransferase YpeA [wastewater metagenome]|uniref:Acetyltransferase YpeA n=2 Tax=unclassified sequences TaxID=12908 RepID=A0A5B8R937_9ZZZZ|nr:GNAT family N-acetyltransferase [Arhodomonas sp. KWT]QEA04468.1 acetyltransferase YpeA [uncultured organism]
MDNALATDTPALALRFAGPGDCPTILAFIRELADYERLSHEVVADESRLMDTLFGDHPYAEVIIAELDGEAVGFALFFHNYSTFLAAPGIYLEDLYVRPVARGHGIGQALLTALARLAVARGCGRLEWSVLDWNAPAIGFYERLGARAQDEWVGYRLTGDALRGLAAVEAP